MRKFGLAVLLLLLPLSAFAQSSELWAADPTVEITPFVGYRYGGTIFAEQSNLFAEDVDVDSSESLGITVGFPLGRTPMKLELTASRQQTELVTDGGLFDPSGPVADIDVTYFHAGVQVPFAASRNLVPFVVASAGVTNLDPKILNVEAENRFSASAGVGVKVPLGRNAGLRLEARGWWTSLGNDDRYDDCWDCDYYEWRNLAQGETNLGIYFKF